MFFTVPGWCYECWCAFICFFLSSVCLKMWFLLINIIPRVPYYEQTILLMIEILHYLKDPKLLNYGNYGIFLIMGKAGFYIISRSLPKP